MRKICLIIMIAFMGTAAVAQDWAAGADGSVDYNCELVDALVNDYGDQPYLRRDGIVHTLAELLVEAAPSCSAQETILHTANVAEDASLYDCADAACDVVEQVGADVILDVIAVDGDWLTVRRGGRTLYLPGDVVDKLSFEMRIKDSTPTFQVHAGCFVSPSLGPGRELSIGFLIAGNRREQVTVELWRAGGDSPLPFASREEIIAPHTLAPGIEQLYNVELSLGEYVIDMRAADHRYQIAWEITRAGPYRVDVGCA